MEWKIEVVEKILKELGCDLKRTIFVFNKIDLISDSYQKKLTEKYGHLTPLFISGEKRKLD